MPWATVHLTLVPEEGLVRLVVGLVGLTREEARRQTQAVLDRVPKTEDASLEPVADAWREGPPGDTVTRGLNTWLIVEYDTDPVAAVQASAEALVRRLNAAGARLKVGSVQN